MVYRGSRRQRGGQVGARRRRKRRALPLAIRLFKLRRRVRRRRR